MGGNKDVNTFAEYVYYTGLYNPREQQIKFNPETEEVIEIYQQPTVIPDTVSMQHKVESSIFVRCCCCVFRNFPHSAITRSRRNQLRAYNTYQSTLIIPDMTKTESIHCF